MNLPHTVLGKVSKDKDLTTVFRELLAENPEKAPVGKDARHQISRVVQFLDEKQISGLIPLIQDETINRTDIERAIYFTTDQTKKIALAQLFLMHSDPKKWDKKVNELETQINAIYKQEQELVQPNPKEILKNLGEALSRENKEAPFEDTLKPFVLSLVELTPEKRKEAIKAFAEANNIPNFEKAVSEALNRELEARSKKLVAILLNFGSSFLERNGNRLLDLVKEGKYDRAAQLFTELVGYQVDIKRGSVIEAFQEREGVSYLYAIALLDAAEERRVAASRKAKAG